MDEATDTGRTESLRDRILTHVAVAAWRLAEGEERHANPVATAIRAVEADPAPRSVPASPEISRCTSVVPYRPPVSPVGQPIEKAAPTQRCIDRLLACARGRRVGPWSLGYLAFAFGGIQVVEALGGIFHWSALSQQSMVTVLGCGFPAALVLSWYHGERGPQRVTLCEMVLLGVVVVASVLVVGTVWNGGS